MQDGIQGSKIIVHYGAPWYRAEFHSDALGWGRGGGKVKSYQRVGAGLARLVVMASGWVPCFARKRGFAVLCPSRAILYAPITVA